jgi:subtilisin family serine protease
MPAKDRGLGQRQTQPPAGGNRGPDRCTIQIELKTSLRALAARAKSQSPFRFSTIEGQDLKALHELLLEHALAEAHPTFRSRHPRQRRQRSKAEKERLSRFVDLHFPLSVDTTDILAKLRALPEVAQAVEVRGFSAPAVPADPLIGTTDQLAQDPATQLEMQWYIFRCGVNRAWARASGNGVVIADVDFGFFLDHDDLQPNVESNHTFNAVDGTTDVSAGDQDHGTGVLGLAGAASNDLGIAGVAFNAKFWAIQYNQGNGTPLPGLPLVNAIDWIMQEDSGGRRVVINIEAQTTGAMGNCEQIPGVGEVIRLAISKRFVVCVTAGNGGVDAGLADDGTTPIPPTGSILVGATDFDQFTNPRATSTDLGSNFGDRIVVSAPGDGMHDITCGDQSSTDYHSDFGGTSGATAKVAGAVALMLEANPQLTHEQIKTMLVATGSPLATDQPMGVFLNADAAVTAAIQSKTP